MIRACWWFSSLRLLTVGIARKCSGTQDFGVGNEELADLAWTSNLMQLGTEVVIVATLGYKCFLLFPQLLGFCVKTPENFLTTWCMVI